MRPVDFGAATGLRRKRKTIRTVTMGMLASRNQTSPLWATCHWFKLTIKRTLVDRYPHCFGKVIRGATCFAINSSE